jgi:hypothetical protein
VKHPRICLALGSTALAAAIILPLATHAAPPDDNPPMVRIAADTAAPINRIKTVQMRGFSMQLNDPKATQSYLRAIDELADMGCTWINLAIAARQDNVYADAVKLNLMQIPSMPDVLKIIKKAKSRGMGVMLMPMVLLSNTGSKDWRGIIDPRVDNKAEGKSDWDNWFVTYRMFITNMADLAQRSDVDIFVVGSELLSSEGFRDRWVETINEIKNGTKDPLKGTLLTHGYHGKLTYSANWDHYNSVTFWDQLDYVGMNNYNELWDGPGATVEQLDGKWVKIKKEVLDFAASQKKPFMFTEVGWHNLKNTIKEPWNYVPSERIVDYNEQLHAFESFVQTWQPVPKDQFMGAFIWEWCPDGKPGDVGTYSLQGTPALDVVKKWFVAP